MNAPLILKCSVCDRICHRFSYGVPSCEGCRLFFRQIVINQRMYECPGPEKCGLGKKKGCKSCRLDKCLRIGMDWNRIKDADLCWSQQLRDEFESRKRRVDKEAAEKAENSLAVLPTQLNKSAAEEDCLLRFLVHAEERAQMLFGKTKIFSGEFPAQFASLRDLLSWQGNLTEAICAISRPSDESPQLVVSTVNGGGGFSYRANPLLTDLVATIDFVRALPLFRKLHIDDQECLLSYVAMPLLQFSNKYYSSRQNSPVVVVNLEIGFSPMQIYRSQRYRDDQTIQRLATHLFQTSMGPFNSAKLDKIEFLLLKMIIASHSAASGLSAHGQNLLQQEAEHIAGLLMRLLQRRLGPLDGAKRYAECVHLAECTFRSAYKARQLFVYVAMVTDQGNFHAKVPPALVNMCLLGGQ